MHAAAAPGYGAFPGHLTGVAMPVPAEIVTLLRHDVNARNAEGCSALHLASRANLVFLVRDILHHPHVDVNCVDLSGRTALHVACRHGHADVCAQLLAHANVDVNMDDEDGSTPLMEAIRGGSRAAVFTICDQLLKRGADVHAVCPHSNDTPVVMACRKGYVDVCKLLLAAGANVNFVHPLTHNSLLNIAIGYGHNDLAQMLIDRGANVDHMDEDGVALLSTVHPRSVAYDMLQRNGAQERGRLPAELLAMPASSSAEPDAESKVPHVDR